MADKPVMEMNSIEFGAELERLARREFARKCIREDEAATADYLRRKFPPEGKPGDDPPPDPKTAEQQAVDEAVKADCEAFFARP